VTAGLGEGPTALAAFDRALWNGWNRQFHNLIYLSFVIPPVSQKKKKRRLVRESPLSPSARLALPFGVTASIL